MNQSKESIEEYIYSLGPLLAKTHVRTVSYFDERYPALLKEITDPPPVLFYRGKLVNHKEACVAIVGSRKMSSYGLLALPKITSPLIDAGVTIVSGMAYGIDSAAHAQSLKLQSRTIAVLGSGVDDDSIYPRAHFKLAHEILDNGGLIVSEQPPGTPGLKHHFVARNRIIAGLSLGVVIVECKTKSGALLTADFAADFNRNLYAVPGPIYSSLSEGPHQLIRDGAMLTTSGEEILDDLAISINQLPLKTKQKFSEIEQRVLECMQDAPCSIDQLIDELNLSANEIASTIVALEIKGVIKNLGADNFIKI